MLFDTSVFVKCLVTAGHPEENVSKMLSQIQGTQFAEREVTAVFFWETQGKEKGISQQVQTWRGHRSRTRWIV